MLYNETIVAGGNDFHIQYIHSNVQIDIIMGE